MDILAENTFSDIRGSAGCIRQASQRFHMIWGNVTAITQLGSHNIDLGFRASFMLALNLALKISTILWTDIISHTATQ